MATKRPKFIDADDVLEKAESAPTLDRRDYVDRLVDDDHDETGVSAPSLDLRHYVEQMLGALEFYSLLDTDLVTCIFTNTDGQKKLEIRRWTRCNEKDYWFPTKQGVRMPLIRYKRLLALIPRIFQAVDNNTGERIHVGYDQFLTYCTKFRLVHIRKWWKSMQGQELPSKSGIALTPEQLRRFDVSTTLIAMCCADVDNIQTCEHENQEGMQTCFECIPFLYQPPIMHSCQPSAAYRRWGTNMTQSCRPPSAYRRWEINRTQSYQPSTAYQRWGTRQPECSAM